MKSYETRIKQAKSRVQLSRPILAAVPHCGPAYLYGQANIEFKVTYVNGSIDGDERRLPSVFHGAVANKGDARVSKVDALARENSAIFVGVRGASLGGTGDTSVFAGRRTRHGIMVLLAHPYDGYSARTTFHSVCFAPSE